MFTGSQTETIRDVTLNISHTLECEQRFKMLQTNLKYTLFSTNKYIYKEKFQKSDASQHRILEKTVLNMRQAFLCYIITIKTGSLFLIARQYLLMC